MISSAVRRRTAFLIGLLVVTFVLAAVLAFQAVTASLYHRATVRRVLDGYAAAAAAEFAVRAPRDLEFYGHYPVMLALARLGAGTLSAPLPSLVELTESIRPADSGAVRLVRSLFRLDLASGAVEVRGAEWSETLLAWIRDSLSLHARSVFEREWRSAVVVQPGPEARLFVYAVARDEVHEPVVAYGLEAEPTRLRALLERTAHSALLPATLLKGIGQDSVLGVVVRDAAGNVLARVEPPGGDRPAVAASTMARPEFGSIHIEVTLAEDAANALVIGGVPARRAWFALVVLALTAALMVAAILLLRREQELARLRTEFVSNVSHELRTPLAQIRMFTETLLLDRVRSDAERRRSLEILDREARRLGHLVENVLQFARSERGTNRLAPERTDLGAVVMEATEAFQPLAAAQEVRIETDVVGDTSVDIDRGAMQQVLLNLLDNAVKYGPAGQRVCVSVRRMDGMARVMVDDAGPGIPHAQREIIWGRFSRLEHDSNSHATGAGIGLAVVRDLVERSGGRAWCEEAPTGGARFVVELPEGAPLPQSSNADARAAAPRAPDDRRDG